MIDNNNKKPINKLAKESFKANKSRNRFAVISIALTTLLFTVLFTIGMSMLKSSEYSTMKQVGMTFHGGFKSLTKEEYEKIKEHKSIKDSGVMTHITVAENKEFAKRSIEINYANENYIENAFVNPIKGKLPQKENEILVDDITLDMLGLPQEINQTISITYKIDKTEYTKDFVVCGIYDGVVTNFASILYTSKEFAQRELANIDQVKIREEYGTGIGLINLNVNFSNSLFIEKKLEKLATESGYNIDKLGMGVNWAYMGGKNIDMGTIAGVAGLIVLIMVTGYLIIYNIFYISIVRDIKFYGLLKTIGTTKKQIKKIIVKQALILASIGITIGLILGYGIGMILVPVVMRTLTIEYVKVSINPIIFIGSILFSLITVLISAYKPAKVASKVSPVEAVRYSGVSEGSKKKLKKTSNGAKLRKMALSNVFKNKKKAIVVTMSLSLSIILLNVVYTIVSGFDMDKYLINSIGTDFTIGDTSFYRWNFNSENLNSVTDELIRDIENIDGVGIVNKMYHRALEIPLTDTMKENLNNLDDKGDEEIKEEIKRTKYSKTITGTYYGIDKGLYKLIEKYIVEGKFDIEKFESGNYIIAEEYSDDYYNIGKLGVGGKVVIPLENGENKEYEILAIVENIPLYMNIGYSYGGIGSFTGYLPTSEFKNTTSNDSIMTAMFNVENDSTKDKVEKFINDSMNTNPSLDYRSKDTYVKEFENMVSTYEIIGYGLSIIVGLVGILNFTNVMITSIISRQKEIAMLKSIGMTQKQVKNMIILEGIYYAVITIGVVIIIGIPLTYLGVNLVAGGMRIFSYSFRILPIVIASPILLLIAIIIPMSIFKNISKSSIVEALRENE